MAKTTVSNAETSRDNAYLDEMLEPVKICAHYRPKLGQGGRSKSGNADNGLSLAEFAALHAADPFYNWLGLDNPLMYAAHKAAGGMTSVYRQIGIGSERLFRQIIRDHLDLTAADTVWSYQVADSSGKERTLSLDARIPTSAIPNAGNRERFRLWLRDAAKQAGCEQAVIAGLAGAVFEVRQGYKSKDSKRQNADIANCTTAYKKALFPVQ